MVESKDWKDDLLEGILRLKTLSSDNFLIFTKIISLRFEHEKVGASRNL
jgi:hypothetical protein